MGVGGDEVWAYHPSRTDAKPPGNNWNVPHDGQVDSSFRVSRLGGERARDSGTTAILKPATSDKRERESNHDLAASDPYGPPPVESAKTSDPKRKTEARDSTAERH